MTDEEKAFIADCCKFKNYANIGEYIVDIQKCLVLSSWRYSDDDAKEIIENEAVFIKQAFERGEPTDDVAAEIGYFAG